MFMFFTSIFLGSNGDSGPVQRSGRWQNVDEIARDHLRRKLGQTQQRCAARAEGGECQQMSQVPGHKGACLV